MSTIECNRQSTDFATIITHDKIDVEESEKR